MRAQRLLDRARDAREDRRVPLGVAAGLRLAKRHHEVEEVADVVGLERDHELLVVDPERVGRVDLDRRELVPGGDVLVHDPLPRRLRELVPGPRLHHRVDEQVARVGVPDDLAALVHRAALALHVLRPLRHREVRIRRAQVAAEGGRHDRRPDLAEVLEPLGHLPQHEIGVGPDPVHRVGADREPLARVLDDALELSAGRLLVERRQAPECRVERVEREVHELPVLARAVVRRRVFGAHPAPIVAADL